MLVIGTGAAGMRAAIAAHDAGGEVIVVGKRAARSIAHTVLASGGINAALGTRDPEDSWQQHAADTLREGYWLGDPRSWRSSASDAPAAIAELSEWGCPFARTAEGALDQRFFGAHRWRRTCFAGDYTGRAIVQTLAREVERRGIPIVENTYVSKLLVADGTCFGALGFELHDGERVAFIANAVVLCGGGHTRLWRRSSSRRDENFGEGMFLALEAGCTVRDMELVQFHPTGMVAPEEMAGTFVTEAVRGEGGRLFNADGERFMERYDPQRLELSTRDRVALANYTEIHEGAAVRTVACSSTSPTCRRSRSSNGSPGCIGSSSSTRCSTSRPRRWRSRRPRTTRWAASSSTPRPTRPRSAGSSRRASAPAACTAPTASGATRSPRRSSTAGAPVRRPSRSASRVTCRCVPAP